MAASKCRWKKTSTGWTFATKNGVCRIKATGDTTFSGTTEYKAICRRPDLSGNSSTARGGLPFVQQFGCHVLTWLK
jgi:hypothetical protein